MSKTKTRVYGLGVLLEDIAYDRALYDEKKPINSRKIL